MNHLLIFMVLALSLSPLCATEVDAISEIIVTSQRKPQAALEHSGNISLLGPEILADAQHQHIHELLNRAAGIWVLRGSGQEHQTAMRSPVLGGAGACGAFLIIEDSIPIRPASFCNVNQLVEANTELAQSIEVIRGPGNALFGSNALHGIVNTIMPMPGGVGAAGAMLEVGANDFVRVRSSFPFVSDANWLASIVYADDGGFRDSSGYSQGKLHIKRTWSSLDEDFTLALSATDLQQETAGFIYGKDSYKDPELRAGNPNPDAFRDDRSLRIYGIWRRSFEDVTLDVRPYMRRSEMDFLHHATPGTPREKNGQTSGGALIAVSMDGKDSETVAGIDFEWSDFFLEEWQSGAAPGPPMQSETRPAGWHYDYQVVALTAAPYVQSRYRFGERLSIDGGLRFEYTHYDYRNHLLPGNTRDDGSVCGFGGCLYSRPDDRTDTFRNVSPNLSFGYRLTTNTSLFSSFSYGFRAPQGLELYRLQNGQRVSDLDSENLGSAELGIRTSSGDFTADLVVYAMRKRDSVFRDSSGFSVSGARSRHDGIEATFDWRIDDEWRLKANISYAHHEYDFSATGRGESFVKGNDIDMAPRWLGSTEVLFEPTPKLRFGLQLTSIGSYYLEPGNQFEYSGHVIGNLRVGLELEQGVQFVVRGNNITNEAIADRADYASRQYRYLPGRGREFFIEFRFSPSPQ